MTREDIINQVEKYLFQSVANKIEIESNKLEFKTKWYDLKSDEVFTCVRHISGIANAFGGGGGYLIFGYDPRTWLFTPARMSDSGHNDPSEIYGVINRRLSNDVSIEVIDHSFQGNPISVVYVSPSITKPHMLPFYKDKNSKEFRHVTFIREGTKTDLATKDDFEKMYSDRGNIQIDHQLEVSFIKRSYSLYESIVANADSKSRIEFFATTHTENIGSRALGILSAEIDVEVTIDSNNEKFPLRLANINGASDPIILLPGKLQSLNFSFWSKQLYPYNTTPVRSLNRNFGKLTESLKSIQLSNIKFILSNSKIILPIVHFT